MSELTLSIFRDRQQTKSPMTPREARVARRQAAKNENVSARVDLLLDGFKVSRPAARESVKRAVLAQGFLPREITEIQNAVKRVLQSRPDFIDPLPVVAVDERTYRAAQVERLNNVDPQTYRETMLRAVGEVPQFRPIAQPSAAVDAFRPPPPPEPPPKVSPADAIYNAARARLGLPPCSKSSSEHWAAKTVAK